MRYTFLFRVVLNEMSAIYQGLWVTIQISAASMILSTTLGIGLTYLTTVSGKRIQRVLAGYIEIMRNTPLLVQLYFIYFGLYEVGIASGSFSSIVITLTLCNGAYLGEIIRAGLESVPRTQIEAGESLGLTFRQVFFHLVLPQALRNVIPPVANQYITILLSSSFASVVAVDELTATISRLSSFTFRTFEFYAIGALMYVGLAVGISILSGCLEYRLTTGRKSVSRLTG
jgi:polar amino acid transport system permease protein